MPGANSAPPPEAVAGGPDTVRPTSDTDTVRPRSSTAALNSYALTGTALSLRGRPYRDGGTDPNGFDCSGFTQYVFGQHGLQLPREVRDQWGAGKAVKSDQIAPGDLMFFTTVAPGASHVGISLGGDEFVHAPSSTGVVRVERVSSSYWATRFVGARRIGSAIYN